MSNIKKVFSVLPAQTLTGQWKISGAGVIVFTGEINDSSEYSSLRLNISFGIKIRVEDGIGVGSLSSTENL